jgi:hypothetical protein
MNKNIPEILFSYRNPQALSSRVQLNTQFKLANYFRGSWDEDTIDLVEEVKLLLLNQSLHVLGIMTIARGSGCMATVDVRMVLAAALKFNAKFLALSHNHPSNNARPSREDEELTYRVVKACEIVGIGFLEHIVVTRESHSFIIPKKLKHKLAMTKIIKVKMGDKVRFIAQDGSEKEGKVVEVLAAADKRHRIQTPNKTIWRVPPEQVLSIV